MLQKCVVQIQYGSYSGKQIVFCDEDTESETIKAKAYKQAGCNFLSMAYQSAKIISREEVN